ncbi:DNA polymerase IV [Abyssicoccus albus]|uniref:DNA polymerase IV n=1 Tax=Abyssicoccus albus TaxID=1817405 RepID=A0A3N5C6S0_9BACL|nr:DNA polymerase IV [Abyssicoccus albus]RPF55152.1 DNA polymerase-4 [Abyssicoccus albus]
MSERRIIHVDMDAFYAQIEQRDNPRLKGQPVIISGSPNTRSVVSTCSYEARKFGVHSAMPASTAYKLCPHGVYIKPRMSYYKEVSDQFMNILKSYSTLLQNISLDEAFLDITHLVHRGRPAHKIALQIQQEVLDTLNLTCTMGVSYNKFLAKIASDMNKPYGLTVINYQNVDEILRTLDIGKFPGIGKVSQERLRVKGINTGADLRALSMSEMDTLFGKRGKVYYDRVRGIDYGEVVVSRERKSIGKETTFDRDIEDDDEVIQTIKKLSERVAARLNDMGLIAHTVTVKLKYSNYDTHTKQWTEERPIMKHEDILEYATHLYYELKDTNESIRLIGVSVSHLAKKGYVNMTIYDFV